MKNRLSMGLGRIEVDDILFGLVAVEFQDVSEMTIKALKELDPLYGKWVEGVVGFQDSFKLVCSFRDKPDFRSESGHNKVELEFIYPDGKHYAHLIFPEMRVTISDEKGYVAAIFEAYPEGPYGTIRRGVGER